MVRLLDRLRTASSAASSTAGAGAGAAGAEVEEPSVQQQSVAQHVEQQGDDVPEMPSLGPIDTQSDAGSAVSVPLEPEDILIIEPYARLQRGPTKLSSAMYHLTSQMSAVEVRSDRASFGRAHHQPQHQHVLQPALDIDSVRVERVTRRMQRRRRGSSSSVGDGDGDGDSSRSDGEMYDAMASEQRYVAAGQVRDANDEARHAAAETWSCSRHGRREEEQQDIGHGAVLPFDPEAHPGVVRLNIGGTMYSTTASTLLKIPDTFFTALLSGNIGVLRDGNDAIFVDRPGDLFAPILDYLRTGSVSVPPNRSLRDLQHEAEFYGVQPLVDVVYQMIEEQQSRPLAGVQIRQIALSAAQERIRVPLDRTVGVIVDQCVKAAARGMLTCRIGFLRRNLKEGWRVRGYHCLVVNNDLAALFDVALHRSLVLRALQEERGLTVTADVRKISYVDGSGSLGNVYGVKVVLIPDLSV